MTRPETLTVTVVTPSYNQVNFLEATLRSVLDQGFEGLEYLVIDGGSTDGSRAIIERYAHRLAYWCSERDSGQAEAINKGLRRATGEVLAWLNSDDTYLPGTLSAVARFFAARPNVDVVYGDVLFTDAAGRALREMKAWPFSLRQQVCATNLIPQPAAFFRRRVYERTGGLDQALHYALDYDLWVRAGLAGARFEHMPGVWATYRLHESSKTEAQALRFAGEVRQVVNRALAASPRAAAWTREAESNYQQLLAETHLRLGDRRSARRHYLQAVRACPWRPKALALLGYAVDARLGQMLRRLRWLAAGRAETPWLR